MLKNALEASKKGEKITISCSRDSENVVFSVHNQHEISDAIKMQIFQRSFSTKGENI
jgi:signal transduction histidine kinase